MTSKLSLVGAACAWKPLVLTILASLVVPAMANDRPNVVMILADDIGYSDIGCFGGEIDTPNLDRLAEGGVRFTQFYNTGRCCPTRASLLTGLYPHQAGMGWMVDYAGPEGYAGDLNRRCVTLAEVLRAADYRTYMAGKWHVTPKPTQEQAADDTLDKHNWPLQRGFDRFYGTICGSGSYYDPATLTRNNELIVPDDPEDYYYTDALSKNASQFIREHDRQKPFFLYLSYSAAHWPLHAKPADIAKYKGRYDEGWDKLRDERLARLKELGIVGESVELAPNVRDWSDMDRKEWQSARMEVYAAMIDSMDQGIGRVVEALRETGQLDNTLILYLQDNGASQEEGRSQQARQRREKLDPIDPTPADQLQFASVPEYTRSGQPVIWGRGVVPGPANTYMEVGREWANASNTPFRLFKHYVHEGGIATPLIAHWPRGMRWCGVGRDRGHGDPLVGLECRKQQDRHARPTRQHGWLGVVRLTGARPTASRHRGARGGARPVGGDGPHREGHRDDRDGADRRRTDPGLRGSRSSTPWSGASNVNVSMLGFG